MILTNNASMPVPLFRAIQRTNSAYKGRGEAFCSVTELLKPAHQWRLGRDHQAEIVEDAQDVLWRVLGTAVHLMIECANDSATNTIVEERLSARFGDTLVSGGVDCYHSVDGNGTLYDWKVTSVWSEVYDSRGQDWEYQLNMYRYMYEKAGYPVNNMSVVMIFRDWSASKALAGGDYPRSPWKERRIRRIEDIDLERWVEWRLAEMHEQTGSGECSAEERWEKATVWAVMAEGRKSAVRLHDTEESALTQLPLIPKGYIQHRPGARTRCEQYCNVSQWCGSFQAYKEARDAD